MYVCMFKTFPDYVDIKPSLFRWRALRRHRVLLSSDQNGWSPTLLWLRWSKSKVNFDQFQIENRNRATPTQNISSDDKPTLALLVLLTVHGLSLWLSAYPTYCSLHHGIKTPFRRVQVPGDELLFHFPFELLLLWCHIKHMSVAKCSLTLLVNLITWLQQFLLVGVSVRKDCFINKGTKSCSYRNSY